MSSPIPHIFYPYRVLYVFAVIIVSLFVFAFVWFMFYFAFSPIQSSVMGVVNNMGNDTLTTTLQLADTFMMNLWAYLLVIALLGLAYWVYLYSQHRGEVMYP